MNTPVHSFELGQFPAKSDKWRLAALGGQPPFKWLRIMCAIYNRHKIVK
jgi:hypothetical protein